MQELISKARQTYQWRTVDMVRYLADLIAGLIASPGALIVVSSFGWWISFAVLIGAIPRWIVQSKQGTLNWSIWGWGAPRLKELYYLSGLLTNPQSVPEIRMFRAAPALLKKFAEVQEDLYQASKRGLDRFLKWQGLPLVVEGTLLCGLALWQLNSVLCNTVTVGSFILFITMAEQFLGEAVHVVSNLTTIKEDALFARHFFEVLDIKHLIKDGPNA